MNHRHRLFCCLLICIVVCIFPALAAPTMPPLLLDPGGFSLDLSHAGTTQTTGPDLLTNGDMERAEAGKPAGWTTSSYVWMASGDAARAAEIEQRSFPLMQWGVTDKGLRGKAARLAIPMAAYNPADPPAHEFCAIYHQQVVLPALATPTSYVLSWQARGHSDPNVPNSRPYTRVTFYDSEDPNRAAQTRVYAQTIFPPGENWRPGELTFIAPQKTRMLDVRIALTGVGEVEYDDVALHLAVEQETGPSARLMPLGLLDNLYCLPSGNALAMIFGFRNATDQKLEAPQLVVQLPSFVEVMELAPALTLLQKRLPDGLTEHRVDLTQIKSRIHGSDFGYPWNQWDGLCLFVRTKEPAAERRHRTTYWLEDGAYRSLAQTFDLQVVPPLPTVKAPTRFRTGAHPFLIWSAGKPETVQGFAQTYEQVGFNSVHCSPSALSDELGRRGIERFTQPFANGFAIGGQKPDNAVFRDIEGTAVPEAICPTEVYRRGPYFESAIVNDMLRKLLVTEHRADQLMCNWEPYMYLGKGCYCDRCREEFKAFSKLGDVDATWPKTVAEKHGDVLRKFRRWQHAQLMVTIEQTVQALGKEAGREMHFIPELHYANLTAAWEKLGDAQEFAAVDYLDNVPVLNAWGPYNWYVFGRGPYEYVRGLHLSCQTTATEVKEFLQSRLPAGQKPRLYAFPFGTYEGATEPEALAFEFLTYFLNGYEGAIAYLYPGGCDGRHWRALAEANRQIATFESYVRQGQPARRHTVTPASPLPPPDLRFLQSGCMGPSDPARWQKLSLLQSWEYERQGRRLIAVGNFWERGECFFRLRLHVTGPGKFVLREPLSNRCFAGKGGHVALTSADLTQGVLLHSGAMRYSFFVLEPYDPGAKYGPATPPEQMEAAMQERLPAIRKAAAE